MQRYTGAWLLLAALSLAARALDATAPTASVVMPARDVILANSVVVPGVLVNVTNLTAGTALGFARAYRGIRFARADRFDVPQMWAYPHGTLMDTSFDDSRACPQPGVSPLTEDCLFLDVYAPTGWGSRAPVMVWIHGGSLTGGSKNPYTLVAFPAETGVVAVSLNYRLNVFGYFTPEDKHAPKNYGTRDQIAGLRWVQANIMHFDGDPDRVTIFGESAGGLSVMVLYQSQLAANLFHRAIAMSPGYQDVSQFHMSAGVAARSMSRECARALNCSSMHCVRGKTIDELLENCKAFVQPPDFISKGGEFFAGFDGEVLAEPLWEALCRKEELRGFDRPLMVGGLPNEWRLFAGGYSTPGVIDKFLSEHVHGFTEGGQELQSCVTEKLLDLYNGDQANCPSCNKFGDPRAVQLAGDIEFTLGPQLSAASAGGPRYRYLLDVEGEAGPFGATHAVDLNYIFPGHNPWLFGSPSDKKTQLGAIVRQYFASFARSGVPSSNGTTWEQVVHGQNTPFMRFSLEPRAHGTMDYTSWYSNASAALLGDIACGQMQAVTYAWGGCAITRRSASSEPSSVEGRRLFV